MAAKPPVELLSHTLRDMRTLTDNDALLERALSSISTYHPYPTGFLPRVRKLKFTGWDNVQYTPLKWSQIFMSSSQLEGTKITIPDGVAFYVDAGERFDSLKTTLDRIPNCSVRFGTTKFVEPQAINLPHPFSGFIDCSTLKTLDLFKLNTSGIKNTTLMFKGCSSLTALDISTFDTSKVEWMDGMFQGCSSLPTLDLSSFNTSQVQSMQGMFKDCSSLTALDLSSFDTRKVNAMLGMFQNCKSLRSLDLSSFSPPLSCNTSYMFDGCSSLTSLDLSGFQILTSTQNIFNGCSNLKSLTMKGEAIKQLASLEDDPVIQMDNYTSLNDSKTYTLAGAVNEDGVFVVGPPEAESSAAGAEE